MLICIKFLVVKKLCINVNKLQSKEEKKFSFIILHRTYLVRILYWSYIGAFLGSLVWTSSILMSQHVISIQDHCNNLCHRLGSFSLWQRLLLGFLMLINVGILSRPRVGPFPCCCGLADGGVADRPQELETSFNRPRGLESLRFPPPRPQATVITEPHVRWPATIEHD